MNQKQSKKKGFTLIELLVVITIIGILAGIAFVGFGDVFGTAGRTAAQKNLKTIYESLVTNSQFSFPMSDDVKSSADFAIWYRKKTNDTRPELWFLPDDEKVRDLVDDEAAMEFPHKFQENLENLMMLRMQLDILWLFLETMLKVENLTET
jgi:prepilin-type N-terminal cleavage/methylation domain-containing protein